MVGTRTSLDTASSEVPVIDDPSVPKELRRLYIDGNDTLKGGEKKKDDRPKRTYHWRGCVYEVTDDTPQEWIEQEPERYKKKETKTAEEKPKQKSVAEDITLVSPGPKVSHKSKLVRELAELQRSDVSCQDRRGRGLEAEASTAKNLKRKSTSVLDECAEGHRQKPAKKAKTGLPDIAYLPQSSRKGVQGHRKKPKSTKSESDNDGPPKFDFSTANAHNIFEEIDDARRKAAKKYRVEMLQEDELKAGKVESIGLDEDADSAAAAFDSQELAKSIVKMAILNSKMERIKTQFENIKKRGLTAEAVKAFKERRRRPELHATHAADKHAQHEDSGYEDNAVAFDEPLQQHTPDSTDQVSFIQQLHAAANAAPEDTDERSQLDSQLRSPSPKLERLTTPTSAGLRPLCGIAFDSLSESPCHDSVTSVCVSASSVEPSATNRSSRPNDHFGKRQPAAALPDRPDVNRNGDTVRWTFTKEDLEDPARAERKIHEKIAGESKAARKRRVKRELAWLKGWVTAEEEE